MMRPEEKVVAENAGQRLLDALRCLKPEERPALLDSLRKNLSNLEEYEKIITQEEQAHLAALRSWAKVIRHYTEEAERDRCQKSRDRRAGAYSTVLLKLAENIKTTCPGCGCLLAETLEGLEDHQPNCPRFPL